MTFSGLMIFAFEVNKIIPKLHNMTVGRVGTKTAFIHNNVIYISIYVSY